MKYKSLNDSNHPDVKYLKLMHLKIKKKIKNVTLKF